MKKLKKRLTATELLDLINDQWATSKDIMKIGDMCYNNALILKKEIELEFKNKGLTLPKGKVPMESVVDKLQINIQFLKKVSSKK